MERVRELDLYRRSADRANAINDTPINGKQRVSTRTNIQRVHRRVLRELSDRSRRAGPSISGSRSRLLVATRARHL